MTTEKVTTDNSLANMLFVKGNSKADNNDFTNIMTKNIDAVKQSKSDNASKTDKKTSLDKSERKRKNDVIDNKDCRSEKQVQEKSTSSTKQVKDKGQDDIEQFTDNLEKAAQELRDQIKEIFNMTDDELDEKLNEMGITILGLLNPDNGKEFALLANGENDWASILTNENLAQDVTKLNAMYENLNSEDLLGVSQQELTSLVEEAMMRLKNMEETTEETNNAEPITQTVESDNLKNDTDDDNVNNKLSEYVSAADKELKVTIETDKSNTRNSEYYADKDKSARQHSDASVEYYESFITNLEKTVAGNEVELINEIANVKQMREIVNQVVDKIKINVNADTTTMEMQLNPEHLGKVNLTIASKDGELSAKFVVESEMAKEALEIQMDLLKQRFDEQGIKVNAVEVTVSDNNLSNDSQSREYDERQAKDKQRRGIVDIAEEPEVREKIMEEIMKEKGNQVDYSA